MTRFNPEPGSLDKWLVYLDHIHTKPIEMGLSRVNQIKDMLGLDPTFPLIIVGGTNGKGSVCFMLEAILTCAGFNVGCYTSPHLLQFNERIRINQQEVSDHSLCEAFDSIEQVRVRSGISITYFEFTTLAAMRLFTQSGVDVAILEVGLGGRLDAVNIFDADCAILTSIGLDHMEYLGHTRDAIGFEKSGIFRKGKIAICAEPDTPLTVQQHANTIGAQCFLIGDDFGYLTKDDQWQFWGPKGKHHCLPYPALRGANQLQNATACLMALDMLRDCLPVNMNDIRQGLLDVKLPGRFQVFSGQPVEVMDVAHNPAAAVILASNLDAMGSFQQTYAVLSMLKDKDMEGVVQALKHCVDIWLVSSIQTLRGASADELVMVLKNFGLTRDNGKVIAFSDPAEAYVFACKHATKNDRICVLGSFYTVGAVLQYKSTIWRE
ncbi:MAG: bifunctional tetrahydrofolate synthase/dihydrofolate synthase [Nitrosomonas sp.]|nr:bifunctional tetrahydrofolate synthase/dihydrofolate synthase [Nitrosomonas sp.]MDP1949499.1 bifunctional tetrahydrofolate synthase/dihydrofolate synthase [Nitrosomonas sp.]